MPLVTEAMLDGRLRVMLLLGTNMLSSYADAGRVAEALEYAAQVLEWLAGRRGQGDIGVQREPLATGAAELVPVHHRGGGAQPAHGLAGGAGRWLRSGNRRRVPGQYRRLDAASTCPGPAQAWGSPRRSKISS